MRKTYLLSAAAAVTMLFASCEKYDQSDEIGDLKKQLAQTNAQLSSGDATNAALIAANTAAIEAMMSRVATAIDALGDTDAALFDALAKGAERVEGGLEAIAALQAQFDAAYADALVLVNEALAGSIAQDVELAQQIQELRDLIAALELEQGEQGEDGEDGEDGVDGADGVDGNDGAQGPAGSDGVDGVDGVDAGSGSPDGLGEDGTTPDDGGSQTLGENLNGYPSADHAKLIAAGFTINEGQSVFSYQPVAGVNQHYFLAPPTNGVYSWENADTDDVDGTIDEAIAAITNY